MLLPIGRKLRDASGFLILYQSCLPGWKWRSGHSWWGSSLPNWLFVGELVIVFEWIGWNQIRPWTAVFSWRWCLCGPDKNRLSVLPLIFWHWYPLEGLVKTQNILCVASLNGKHTEIYFFSSGKLQIKWIQVAWYYCFCFHSCWNSSGFPGLIHDNFGWNYMCLKIGHSGQSSWMDIVLCLNGICSF